MERTLARSLVGHGAIVLLLGMLAGFPLGPATTEGDLEGIRAWRMAHLEGVLNGLLMIAVAAAAPLLALSRRLSRVLWATLLITGYGNVVAASIAAQRGVRGLGPGGGPANTLVFGLFMLAVIAVLVALLLTAFSSFRREGDL